MHQDGTFTTCSTKTHCDTLAATCCNTLQHTATCCNTLQHTATGSAATVLPESQWQRCRELCHDSTRAMQHAATRCNSLQHAATRCNTQQHTATHCNTLQHTATHCNTLQQGLPLPRYLNHGGSAAEDCAMTQLARLTEIVGHVLKIQVPFRFEFRPLHCLIFGALFCFL